MSQTSQAQSSWPSRLPLTWSYSYSTFLIMKTLPHPATIRNSTTTNSNTLSVVWVTLEALFLPLQFTTKCCQNALIYKKIFIFLNQWSLTFSSEFYWHELLHSIAGKNTRVTYGACACQFNKFLLIIYNTRVVLLTGLTNWLPRGKWNARLLFLWARYRTKR